MTFFILNDDYDRLLTELRDAALSSDWRSAVAEVLGGVDVLPEVCRGDFLEQVKVAA